MTIFLAVMFVTMVLTGVIGIVCDLRWLAYLKRTHTAAWESLGSPPIRPFTSFDEYRRLTAFKKAGEPQRIGDPQLCTLIRRAQMVARLYWAIFAVLIVSTAGFVTGLWS